jgi:hypothetical protein
VGQIERLTLRETPKGGDQELVNFGLINWECFQSA